MILSQELDLRQIATDAGLKPQQAEHFARGLEGKQTNTIGLAREPYTQLQTKFEKALMAVILANPDLVFSDEEDKLRPPFLYRTPKLGTPVHNPKHPRADIIESMVNAPIPAAALVCNFESLQSVREMEHLRAPHARDRLARILTGHGHVIDPFSSNPEGSPTDHTFMATRPFGGLSPIQFEASQMPDLTNKEPGRLIFGEEALAAYERGIIRHHINRLQGRASKFIREILL